jgi:hypothetical protein
MKIKRAIKCQFELSPDVTEEKIKNYLKKNFYRVVEKGPGFIIFIDDEYSDRRSARSDVHTRIGEGKFDFSANAEGTFVKLTYLTPISYPFFIMMAFMAGGLYVRSITPILMSLAFTLPIAYRIYYLNKNVFHEVLES